MADLKDKKDSDYLFMQEKIKQKPIYQNRTVRKCASCILSGVLFALAALGVWAFALPFLDNQAEEQEIQPIEIPEEEENTETEEEEDSTVYITETVSMELEDYKKMYQQLIQIGNQAEKSLVNISVLSMDTDWFDEIYTSQSTVSGVVIGDNGLELLILTGYEEVRGGESLQITFFDRTTAAGTLKNYNKNTGLAMISVNLSDISESTKGVIQYANLGSSKTARNGEPVIAVGNPAGVYGSVLFGNLTSVTQTAGIYDGSYTVLTTDMAKADNSSGVLINWDGKIVGIIQNRCEVNGQENMIQAYGISDMKEEIEHLSNSQDLVYMGIIGADVTTTISEQEEIPVGVYVSEVAMDSPAMAGGIQPGDIITSMSGQQVTNLKDVRSILLKCSNGQNIQVVCQRPDKDGYQELEVTVQLTILQ